MSTTTLALYPFQEEGRQFLSSARRAILADDVGMGKTPQALLAARDNNYHRILVVVGETGTSVWYDENYKIGQIPKWLGTEDVIVVDRDVLARQEGCIETKKLFTVVSYNQMRRHVDLLIEQKYDLVILDEAHNLRSRYAKSRDAASKLLKRLKCDCFCLTADPLVNYISDLWALLNLLYPQIFSSYWAFADTYCDITTAKLRGRGGKLVTYQEVGAVRDQTQLQKDLEKFILRRLKRDYLDLPEEIPSLRMYPLYARERKMYNQMRDHMYVELGDSIVDARNALAVRQRLLQMTVSPELINFEEGRPLYGVKMDDIYNIIEGAGDQKVGVFTRYRGVVDHLRRKYQNSAYMMGGSPDHEGNRLKFQNDPECRCFFGTRSVAGESIDLTAGSILVFPDLGWNPKTNNQAIGRFVRHGQTRAVSIYTQVAEDTFDTWMLELNQGKEDLFNAAIPVKRLIEAIQQREL